MCRSLSRSCLERKSPLPYKGKDFSCGRVDASARKASLYCSSVN
uniref:Uncharacterized protein n=1 Tax=Amphimedon queenslandica TaxID=400682 RepID=A0A1X7TR23_AMPQE